MATMKRPVMKLSRKVLEEVTKKRNTAEAKNRSKITAKPTPAMTMDKKPVSGKTVKTTTYNILTPLKKNVKMVNERTTRKPVVKATSKPAGKAKPKVAPKPKVKPKPRPKAPAPKTKKYRDATDIPGFLFGKGTE